MLTYKVERKLLPGWSPIFPTYFLHSTGLLAGRVTIISIRLIHIVDTQDTQRQDIKYVILIATKSYLNVQIECILNKLLNTDKNLKWAQWQPRAGSH